MSVIEFYNYKKSVITTAKQLFYPKDVVESLKNATTEAEITRIMKTARDRNFK